MLAILGLSAAAVVLLALFLTLVAFTARAMGHGDVFGWLVGQSAARGIGEALLTVVAALLSAAFDS